LIRSRALERFDDDYEVLYSTIRDENIANGLTVEKLISKFIHNKKILSELERTSPTLTISVPDLPNHLFSAALWNTSTEIHGIAIRL
jgi:hypothetical protein